MLRRFFTGTCTCFALIGFLTSCSTAKDYSTSPQSGWDSNDMYYEADYAYTEETGEIFTGAESLSAVSGSNSIGSGSITNAEQKIIKTAYLYMSIKSYDDVLASVKDITQEAGGYVESAQFAENANSQTFNGLSKAYKGGSITVRVPSDEYESVKKRFSELGKVTSENENSENVTQQYYDTGARLTAKVAEESRLLEMIEKAEKIEDLILLEERLSNVRTDVETYQSKLNNIDRMASFSTIRLELTEEADEIIEPVSEDLSGRIKNAFIGSVNNAVRFLEETIIFIVSAIIPILFVSALVLVVIFIVRHQRKSKNKKYKGDKKNEKDV